MVKQIYTDSETDNLIAKIRENNKDFVLSQFLKNSLLNITQEGNNLDINIIEDKLKELSIEIKSLNAMYELWEQKRIKYQAERLVLEQKKQEKLKEDEINRNKEQYRRNNVLSTFKEEIKRDMTEFEYEEYNKSGKNIWAFCELLKGKNINLEEIKI